MSDNTPPSDTNDVKLIKLIFNIRQEYKTLVSISTVYTINIDKPIIDDNGFIDFINNIDIDKFIINNLDNLPNMPKPKNSGYGSYDPDKETMKADKIFYNKTIINVIKKSKKKSNKKSNKKDKKSSKKKR